jgi:hypothetical protein
MSVNVRWNGRGWPGKVPRSPVAPPEGRRIGKKGIGIEKRPPERYRKKLYGKKREWHIKKKKHKYRSYFVYLQNYNYVRFKVY